MRIRWVGAELPCRGQEAPQRALQQSVRPPARHCQSPKKSPEIGVVEERHERGWLVPVRGFQVMYSLLNFELSLEGGLKAA